MSTYGGGGGRGGGNGYGRGYHSGNGGGRRDPEDYKRKNGRGSPPDGQQRGDPPKRPRTDGNGQAQDEAQFVPPERGNGDNRGGGRGRGRGGGGEGRRGGKRPTRGEMELARLDTVKSRCVQSKRGTLGKEVKLYTNYFPVRTRQNWSLHNYRVDFEPDEERTYIKKKLLRGHEGRIGAFIFDGSTLYTWTPLAADALEYTSYIGDDQSKPVQIKLKLTGTVEKGDPQYLQFYNIIVRQCFQHLKFEELGRYFYDGDNAIRLDRLGLELWPGYITSMRNHENQLLLCVEVTNKVLRQGHCLELIHGHRGDERAVEAELVGSIVMTHYNRKTYRVDSIDWEKNPGYEFEQGEGEQKVKVSLASYYSTRYDKVVRDMRQPLLVSRPKARDFHRGQQQPILLIPEFCSMTGLSDAQRNNFRTMQQLAEFTQQAPERRVRNITNFMRRVQDQPEIAGLLDTWGLKFNVNRDDPLRGLLEVPGRVLPKEKLQMRGRNAGEVASVEPNDKADWTHHLKDQGLNMYRSIRFTRWVVIVTQRDSNGVDNLVSTMNRVGAALGYPVCRPLFVYRVHSQTPKDFTDAIATAIRTHENLEMIFSILPGGNPTNKQTQELYGAIKRRCYLDFGVPSQCFLSKHLDPQKSRGLMSVATKVVVQMNAKMGGVPWAVTNPFKSKHTMIVGFDVHHSGKQGKKGPSIGAIVSTTDKDLTQYFSNISFHESRETLSRELCVSFGHCLHAYARNNDKALPERIFMYRDGVGEGQLSHVVNTELAQIKTVIGDIYTAAGKDLPMLTFIVVTKRGNTRFFKGDNSAFINPQPGTIVDDVVTLPERYDFYLIAQESRQGTVSPTTYNVIVDGNGLPPERLQLFTYKLCHCYYNWSGTVAVPAVCQYAHKLSYLSGIALGNSATIHQNLCHKLFFL